MNEFLQPHDIANSVRCHAQHARDRETRTGIAVRPDLNRLGQAADDADAIDACRRARADVAGGGDRLRDVHEAGRLLRSVTRSAGVRTSSTGLTRLQTVIAEAGISRQTANLWQRVGDVPEGSLEAFIASCEQAGREITIAGLLKAWKPKESPERIVSAVLIEHPSERAKERFDYQLRWLGETVFHTTRNGDALVAVVDRLYDEVLESRKGRSG